MYQKFLRYGFSLSPYIASYVGLFIFHNARIALLGYHGLLGIYYLIHHYHNPLIKGIPSPKHDKMHRLRIILTSIITAISIYYRGNYFILETIKDTHILYNLGINNIILFVIVFTTVNAISEEYFWRVLYNRNIGESKTSLITSSDILFTGYHILVLSLFLKIWCLPLVFFGILGASVYRRKHYAIYHDHIFLFLSHSVIDLAIIMGSIMILAP